MLEPRCGESPQVRYLRGGRRSNASPLPDRWAARRDSSSWLGYKLHITETCDDAPPCSCRPAGDGARDREHGQGCAHLVFPNLITNVATTDATVTDNQMTEAVQDALAARNLAPGRHYADSGYASAALVVSALATGASR